MRRLHDLIVSHPLVITVFFLQLWSSLSLRAEAALVNVTVDDDGVDTITGQQVIYTPPALWHRGQNCAGCNARPNPSVAFKRTWHDGTFMPKANPNTLNATFQFEGSALWVYCILAPSKPSISADPDMTFYVDDHAVGTFVQQAALTIDYMNNTLVYANASIPNGFHTFVLQNGHSGAPSGPTLVLFDYLVYSHDDGTSNPGMGDNSSHNSFPGQGGASQGTSSNHKLAIIIPVVVVVVVLAIVAALLFLWWRRRQQRATHHLHYEPPISYTSTVPPITERRVVLSGKITNVSVPYSLLAPDSGASCHHGVDLPPSYSEQQGS